MTAPDESPARTYHHGDLRRALVEAATALAEHGGSDGVVLREAARRVGVSPSAAYRHFPSRDGLLAAVGSAARERLVRRMLAPAPGAPDLAFRATGLAYIEFALDEPGLFEVAFRPCPPGLFVPEDPSPYDVLSAALDALDAAGRLAVPRAGAEEPAWAAVHGAAVLLGERMIPPSERRRVIDATLDMVADGLLRPGGGVGPG
jgi:AcrR family transcriptional regulator